MSAQRLCRVLEDIRQNKRQASGTVTREPCSRKVAPESVLFPFAIRRRDFEMREILRCDR
jgi:hypothetical protein